MYVEEDCSQGDQLGVDCHCQSERCVPLSEMQDPERGEQSARGREVDDMFDIR